MKTLILTLFFLITPVFANDFISSEEAHRLVEKEKALLLDVRTLVEYKLKHIKGAKRIGVSEVPEKLSEIEEMAGGKDKPIVVYCLSGGRSESAKKTLEKAGFKRVYNLGGIGNWKD
jgi:phage shock protein E